MQVRVQKWLSSCMERGHQSPSHPIYYLVRAYVSFLRSFTQVCFLKEQIEETSISCVLFIATHTLFEERVQRLVRKSFVSLEYSI